MGFKRKQNPLLSMELGIVKKVFDSCGKLYGQGGGYSFDYYGAKNWMDVIKWLVSQGYNAEETENVMRSKLMRWASDKAGHSDENCTLEDFLDFNNEIWKGKTQVDAFLDDEFPDSTRKERLRKKKNIKENMVAGGPVDGLTPGMGTAKPASQAATTGNQFYQQETKGSGDLFGAKPKKKKRKKIVKESLNEENVNPYDKLGMSLLKKKKIKAPFKKVKDSSNQNSMKQTI